MTQPSVLTHSLAGIYSAGRFLGSAIYLGKGRFLTCAHVTGTATRLEVTWETENRAPRLAKRIAIDTELDVAVFGLDSSAEPNLRPAVWLQQVCLNPGRPLEEALALGFAGEFCGRSHEFAPRSAIVSRCGDDQAVIDYAMSHGVPEGYSGGPLVIADNKGWVTVGMMQLGGRDRALSVARGSDPILQWLRENKIEFQSKPWNQTLSGHSWPEAREEIDQYCDKLAQDMSLLPVQSVHRSAAGIDAKKGLRLADVYVDLEIEGTPAANFGTKIGRAEIEIDAAKMLDQNPDDRSEKSDEKSKPLTLRNAFVTMRRLVILGLPGSGKSSFFNYLTMQLAQRVVASSDNNSAWPSHEIPPVPFLISLRTWASKLPERFEASAELLRKEVADKLEKACATCSEKDLVRGLRLGRIALFLDGLDEVPDGKRTGIRDVIVDFSRTFPTALLAVTCRVRTYENRSSDCQLPFPAVQIAPLRPELWDEFIGKYFARSETLRSIAEGDGAILQRTLSEAIRANKSLREMAATPMMLNLMAGLHGNRRLPDNRAAVYETLIEALLDDLGKAGNDGRSVILTLLAEVGSDRIKLKQLLAEMSFELHRSELKKHQPDQPTERFISKVEFENRLLRLGGENGSCNLKWAKNLCQAIEERAGILIGVDDKYFKFPHRSFQEFFAGIHIARPRTLAKEGRALLHEGEHWYEVVRWAAGYMADVKEYPGEVLPLLHEIIQPKDSRGTEIPPKTAALLVAAEIASETGIQRLSTEPGGDSCLRELRQALLGEFLHPEQTAEYRIPFGSALGWVGDPRPGVGTSRVKTVESQTVLPMMRWLRVDTSNRRAASAAVSSVYWISKYPVTVGQYAAFLSANPKHPKPEDYRRVFQTPNHPRVGVDWDDAVAFAEWLDRQVRELGSEAQMGLGIPPELGSGAGDISIRLPHDSEWQFAADGGDGRSFPWGEVEPTTEHCNFDGHVGYTTPVGCYYSGGSPFGAEEMAGNVWEWCLNSDDELAADRVIRGGGWRFPAAFCRCSFRSADHPGSRFESLGFRLVLAPVPPVERSKGKNNKKRANV